MAEQPQLIPATDRRAIGDLIAARRRELALTQRQVEDRSGVAQGKISRIERGQSYPALLTLVQVSDALGLKLTLLVEEA